MKSLDTSFRSSSPPSSIHLEILFFGFHHHNLSFLKIALQVCFLFLMSFCECFSSVFMSFVPNLAWDDDAVVPTSFAGGTRVERAAAGRGGRGARTGTSLVAPPITPGVMTARASAEPVYLALNGLLVTFAACTCCPDDRRIEVIANGLTFWGGTQLAIDRTLVSPMTETGIHADAAVNLQGPRRMTQGRGKKGPTRNSSGVAAADSWCLESKQEQDGAKKPPCLLTARQAPSLLQASISAALISRWPALLDSGLLQPCERGGKRTARQN